MGGLLVGWIDIQMGKHGQTDACTQSEAERQTYKFVVPV